MTRGVRSILAGVIGAAAGFLIGTCLGCGIGGAFVDYRLEVVSYDPNLLIADSILKIGTYLGPVVGAGWAIAYVNRTRPPKNSSRNNTE